MSPLWCKFPNTNAPWFPAHLHNHFPSAMVALLVTIDSRGLHNYGNVSRWFSLTLEGGWAILHTIQLVRLVHRNSVNSVSTLDISRTCLAWDQALVECMSISILIALMLIRLTPALSLPFLLIGFSSPNSQIMFISNHSSPISRSNRRH